MECLECNAAMPVDEPTPVHRAIDCLSAALLDVQRLRRRPVGYDGHVGRADLDEDLQRLEATLRELGEMLIRIHETI